MNKKQIDTLCDELDGNAKNYINPDERFIYLEAVYDFKIMLYKANGIIPENKEA